MMPPMTSVCPGCAHEEACGHAEAHECANRVPAEWCSCDPLRKAEAERDELKRAARAKEDRRVAAEAALERIKAERDRYREKALRLVCGRIDYFAGSDLPCRGCAVRLSGGDESYGYCQDVLREVDGE